MRQSGWLPLLLGLGLGLAGGLFYSWIVNPVEYVETARGSLREDFKADYLALIAAAYASRGDLVRARARLALFEELNPAGELAALAQRRQASGHPLSEAQGLAKLAAALQGAPAAAPTGVPSASTTPAPPPSTPPPTPTHAPPAPRAPPNAGAQRPPRCALPAGGARARVRPAAGGTAHSGAGERCGRRAGVGGRSAGDLGRGAGSILYRPETGARAGLRRLQHDRSSDLLTAAQCDRRTHHRAIDLRVYRRAGRRLSGILAAAVRAARPLRRIGLPSPAASP